MNDGTKCGLAREMNYRIAMKTGEALCQKGLVTKEELRQIERKRLRTAAYARVSSGKESMLHSLSSQVSFYSELIQSNPLWLYCGVYAERYSLSLIQMRPT